MNHEYTNAELMFADWDGKLESKTREMVDIEIAAHGLAVIEVQRDATGAWSYKSNSPYNRRLTAESPMAVRGPAAGHPWLKTSYDSTGTLVRGTLNNCAAGITPWGTVLTAEENFDTYFTDAVDRIADASVQGIHKRYGLRDRYGWGRFHDRFDVAKEPNEALRFGWVVEVDPYDPRSVPVKRTAMGRAIAVFTRMYGVFIGKPLSAKENGDGVHTSARNRSKHEAATVVNANGGQAVVYSGDDGQFEYLYRFVSSGRYDPTNRAANMGLLDAGTRYVAKFRDDGTGEWLPLIFGLGPLTPANSFNSQAEVLINTRRAADLSGATKMDRPEDVEANPRTGKIYAVMTNNTRRKPEQVDNANPRPENKHGHIIELVEDGGEATASMFRWQLFIACGDPDNPDDHAFYQGHKDVSWMSCPANVAFDDAGCLWVATDGQPSSIKKMMQCTSLRSRVPNVACPSCSSAACLGEKSVGQHLPRIIGRSSWPSSILARRRRRRLLTPSVASLTMTRTCRRDRVWSPFIVPRVAKSAANAVWCAERGGPQLSHWHLLAGAARMKTIWSWDVQLGPSVAEIAGSLRGEPVEYSQPRNT